MWGTLCLYRVRLKAPNQANDVLLVAMVRLYQVRCSVRDTGLFDPSRVSDVADSCIIAVYHASNDVLDSCSIISLLKQTSSIQSLYHAQDGSWPLKG